MEEGLDNNILDFDVDGENDVNQRQSEFEVDGGNDNQRPSEFEIDGGNDQVFIEDPNVVNEECIIVGKTFCSLDEAYTLYNNYVLNVGFGIRKRHFTRSKVTSLITRYRYVCNKAGRSRDHIPNMTVQGKHLRVSRINCKTLMEISSKFDGSWAVTRFEDIHCHEFTSPPKTRKHRSHKIIHRSKACKSLIQELSQSGLRPVQIKKVVSVISGVEEDIISSKQVSNILGIERRSHLGRECYGIIDYFK
ncbi:protein FAR1-RELATED SEQUENCE 5-like [Impatiens glandulifera]|uniref:protein FAR1-RELATED SEQUENCE 5-like n=1 Tax=Impatiens glandulifera TaxID=253017 RepID=UPI001FB0890B|nr:protein FAR1-RELATED SEQUENCE 5-like [Impatiens glandulifera]